MTLSDLTIVLFSLFNFLRLISYLPQIIRIARDKMGAPTISYATWAMWIGANGSTAAYAAVNVHDWMLCLISAFNSFCCIIVVILTVYKRNEFRQGAAMGGEDALAQRAMTPLCPANAERVVLPAYSGPTRTKCAARCMLGRMKERAPLGVKPGLIAAHFMNDPHPQRSR